jgi:UDP-N-acetyl-D-glucosamine dehydrogenase
VPAVTVGATKLEAIPWTAAALASRDVVLILTAHAGYDWPAIVRDAPLVIDTRNACKDVKAGSVKACG